MNIRSKSFLSCGSHRARPRAEIIRPMEFGAACDAALARMGLAPETRAGRNARAYRANPRNQA